MDLNEIERQCKALMTAHGVGYMTFKWSRSKRRIAVCMFYRSETVSGVEVKTPYEIALSRPYVEGGHLSIEKIREVMLHEIAHAQTPLEFDRFGKRLSHGPRWAANARALGIVPNRCQNLDTAPEGKVSAYCPVCEKVVLDQHRLPLRVKWHRGHGAVSDLGKALKWFKEGTRVYPQDMPARYRTEWNAIKERQAA